MPSHHAPTVPLHCTPALCPDTDDWSSSEILQHGNKVEVIISDMWRHLLGHTGVTYVTAIPKTDILYFFVSQSRALASTG